MKIRSSSAFSMVEVIVAAILFAVAAGGILASMSRARFPITEADQRLQAASYGKKVLDQLRSGIDNGTWEDGAGNYVDGNTYFLPVDPQYPNFNAAYTITEDGGGKYINVTVSWP